MLKELRTKFLDCALYSIPEYQAENLFIDLKSLAKQKTVTPLLGKTQLEI